MRFIQLVLQSFLVIAAMLPTLAYAETKPAIELATHHQAATAKHHVDQKAIDTIRKIVLNQGDDARALANLVQLTRNLPPASTSHLYFELANDYLSRAKYNQAASVLQQLLNQHADQAIAHDALLRLVRLYSSSEVQHTQQAESSQHNESSEGGFSKFALHIANSMVRKIPALAEDPALTFQHAVATRHYGHEKAALNSLTRLKRNQQAGPWRKRALAEQWLQSDRRDEAPLPTVHCSKIEERPHLDGLLSELCWQSEESVRLAYDDKFLYLAIVYPKQAEQTYTSDARPRSYDADLSDQDRVAIRLDVDRDYATAYELAIDHRGWTNDRCWLHVDWNPKWFVAANTSDDTWSVEAAIPLDALVHTAPQPGDAWTIATERMLPEANSLVADEYRLLLFE